MHTVFLSADKGRDSLALNVSHSLFYNSQTLVDCLASQYFRNHLKILNTQNPLVLNIEKLRFRLVRHV